MIDGRNALFFLAKYALKSRKFSGGLQTVLSHYFQGGFATLPDVTCSGPGASVSDEVATGLSEPDLSP